MKLKSIKGNSKKARKLRAALHDAADKARREYWLALKQILFK